jgi:hypothetical protein
MTSRYSGERGKAERKPFWAKCTCGHIWPVAYMPMEMMLAAKLMKRATCPACGNAKNIGIAKQDDGVLLEPANPTHQGRVK